jgi:hypothetical protein
MAARKAWQAGQLAGNNAPPLSILARPRCGPWPWTRRCRGANRWVLLEGVGRAVVRRDVPRELVG